MQSRAFPVVPSSTAYHVQVTDVADGCAASGLVMKGDTILSINGTLVTDEVQGRALARSVVAVVSTTLAQSPWASPRPSRGR